ncbi:MAG: DUF4340 domain-containing protein [Verrucomicrobiota bacterium]|jgi:hypothetical protein
MNRKQLVILLVLVIILGAAGLLLRQHSQSSWQSAGKRIGQKLLGDNFPVNDVAQIALKQGTNELSLVKKDNLWRVRERNDYPASFQEISDFLLKARDLKIVQTEKAGPSQLPRLALVPGQGSNAALVVDFKDQHGKTIQSLLLGKKHLRKSERPSPFGDMGDEGWPDGRYVKAGSQPQEVALISDALSNIEPRPEQWLNKDFFKIEKIRSLAATFPNATNSWKLTRDTEAGEWKLAEAKPGEQLDATKASGVASPLGAPSFTDVAAGAKPATLGLDKPTVVSVETFDNFTYTLKLGQKTNDNYPLTLTVAGQFPKERAPGKDEKPEDKTRLDKEFKDNQKKLEEKLSQEKTYEPWTYLVSTWTVESLLKERSQLLVEKKEEPKKEEPKAEEPKKDEKPPVTPPPPKPADTTAKPAAPSPGAK